MGKLLNRLSANHYLPRCAANSAASGKRIGGPQRSFKDTRCGQALTGMEERLLTYFVNTYLLWRVGVIVIFLFLLFSVFNSEFKTCRDFNHYLRNFLLFVCSCRLTMAISSKQIWA